MAPHPKVTAAGLAGALLTALTALTGLAKHDPSLAAALATVAAALAGYVTPVTKPRVLRVPWRRKPQSVHMFDSTDLGAYPSMGSEEAFATYVDGNTGYQHFGELRKRNLRAKWLTIVVFARNRGMCLDVEKGNATPGEAPGWVRARHAEGTKRPWLYADKSEMAEIKRALAADHISRSEVLLWVADPTGTPHIPPGYDACQYNWKALGRNLDESLVRPGVLGPS